MSIQGTTMIRFAMILVVLMTFVGCHKEYDFEQKQIELDSLGNELFKVWVKDAARADENAEAKVAMLNENFIPFVDAVDAMAPESELPAINTFVQNLLSLVDEGILPALTRKLVLILEAAVGNTPLMDALATPTGPEFESYLPDTSQPDFLGYATGYPDLPALLELQGRIIGENDGFDENGVRTFEESAAFSDLLRVGARELADTQLDPKEEPIAAIVRDMMLVEDERYLPETPTPPVPAVMFDDRGYPAAATVQGEVQFPFVDNNRDGVADINDAGEFIYQNGNSGLLRPFARDLDVNEPVTRDDLGRANTGGPMTFAFKYIDLQKTALGFLLRQFLKLSKEDTMYAMLQAFQLVLGDKVVYQDDIGGYEGYNVDNPMTDMMHAGVNMMDVPTLPETMDIVAELTERREPQIAKMFAAINQILDVMDRYPKAEMNDQQTLVYDLLPFIEEIAADPQLWNDVMEALRDPINRKTGEAFGTLLAFKDSDSIPAADGPYDSCFQGCSTNFELGSVDRFECIRSCPMGEIFDEASNFDANESAESRTAFQKFFHLVRDTETRYEMNIAEAVVNGSPAPQLPPLLVFENQSATFLRAVGGQLDLADSVPAEVFTGDLGEILNLLGVEAGSVASMVSILSDLFGAHMDRNATPDQITRLFNQPDLKFETDTILLDIEDPRGNDGFVLSQHLAYVLFQMEAAGVVDAVHPLAEAFATANKEYILVGIMGVVHNHYSSQTDLYQTSAGGPSPMKGANLRSYEQAISDIMTDTDLFDALYEFSVAAKEVEDISGLPVTENLRLMAHQATKRDGFTNRRNEDFIVVGGGTTVSNPSRAAFMVNAIEQAGDRLDADPEKKEAFEDAVKSVINIMFEAEVDANGRGVFANQGSGALTIHSMRYLAGRAREKQADGGLSQWMQNTLLIDSEDLWKGRFLAATVDLAGNILENEQDEATIDAFMEYQLGNAEGQEQALIGAYRVLVKAVDKTTWLPIAQFIADVIDPDRVWEVEPYRDVPLVSLSGQLLSKTLELDPANDGIFMIHRGLKRPAFGDSPIDIIIDVIARYFSPDPSAETFETADDYRHFTTKMAEYLSDDVNGMERLYEVVDLRLR